MTNPDGPYFEFRLAASDAWTRDLALVIRSGTIVVRPQEHSLVVEAQGDTRILPWILLLSGAAVLALLMGVPPVGGVVGVWVGGYFVVSSYLRGMAGLKSFIEGACAKVLHDIAAA